MIPRLYVMLNVLRNNDYGNNYNNPIKRNLGFSFNLRNSNNSVMYQFFISSLEEAINAGGLIGHHFSFLVSNSFPLRVGFGHVIDLNQLIDYNAVTTKRQVNGFEIDFDLQIYVFHLLYSFQFFLVARTCLNQI